MPSSTREPSSKKATRRRHHAALVGRILVTGVSTSVTLAFVGGMAISDDLAKASDVANQPPIPGPGTAGSGDAGPAGSVTSESTRPRILVVRRIHVIGGGTSGSSVSSEVVTDGPASAPAPVYSQAPAQVPVYTPPPAPQTESDGS